jgi:hypothetical protein
MAGSGTAARATLRAMVAALDRASAAVPTSMRHYSFAGARVAIHLAGSPSADRLLTAIAPLRIDSDAQRADLDLHVWDGHRDNVALPDASALWAESEPTRGLGGYTDAAMQAFYQPEAGVLSVFDAVTRRAHWWLRDADQVPYYERAAPFKHVLQWWLTSRGGALLHSAAVGAAAGEDPAGVLIVGPSGSGKSSTALACIEHGMGFASDDYVIVGGDDPPRVHLAYSTAKVVRASLARFPGYRAHFRNLQQDDEKPMLFVHECAPQAIRMAFRPVALVLPRVAHQRHTSFVTLSPAAMLRALAPSSLLLFPLAGGAAFARMAALCRVLPCLRADLADDPHDVAAAFAGLLELPIDTAVRALA